MASAYFRSYEGREPYMFISYAHLDSDRVVPLLAALKYAPTPQQPDGAADAPAPQKKLLQKRDRACCYRIWYDEGIDAGSEWPENIERHMKNAALIVVFWSQASARSKNCYREMVNANANGKPMLFVRLDDTPLPVEHAGAHPALDAAGASMDTLLTRLLADGLLPPALIGADYPAPPPPVWPLIVGLTVLVAAVVGGAIYFTRSRPAANADNAAPVYAVQAATPVPTEAPAGTSGELAVFNNPTIASYAYTTLMRFDLMPFAIDDPVLKSAVYERLRLSPDTERVDADALAGIAELYICGDTVAYGADEISVTGGNDYAYYVNGEKVKRGAIDFSGAQKAGANDYWAIASMTGLRRLALCYQDIPEGVAFSSFASLGKLTYLDISGNNCASDFTWLSGNTALRELNIAHTGKPSLYALNDLSNLEKVYISRDMISDLMLINTQRTPFDIVVID